MGHSFTSSLFHCTFSTRERQPLLRENIRSRLWPFMGAIARDHGLRALAINGVEDHVHLLLSLPSTLALAKAIQVLKAGSSFWIHKTFPDQEGFAWQEGYGAFSLGISQVDLTKAYIQSQAEHHRRISFQQEFLAFLGKHHLEYDERFLGK